MNQLLIFVVLLQAACVSGQLKAVPVSALIPVPVSAPVPVPVAANPSNNGGAPTTTTTMQPPTTATPPTQMQPMMTITACENSTAVQLSCGGGQVVKIASVFYGRADSVTCPGDGTAVKNTACTMLTATETGQQVCNGQTQCSLSPSNAQFGDPCYGTLKYMQVQYNCVAPMFSSFQCEGTPKTQLTCPGNTTLFVSSAFWGRADFNITCPHPTAMLSGSCSQPLATSMIQTICNGKNQCYLDPTSGALGDPCVGSYKYLKVNYMCQACVNALGDDYQCQYMANQGQCQSNAAYMYSNCLQACTRCENTELPCTKNQAGDAVCTQMAAAGACNSNVTYMTVYCRKTCIPCDTQTTCVNNYNSTACSAWAGANQCTINPWFMMPQCSGACFNCQSNIKCENRWSSVDDCELWASRNQCEENPGFMIPLCTASCLGCNGVDPPCVNQHWNSSQCDEWRNQGECVANAVWMHQYCWKSCVQCQPIRSMAAPACTNAPGMTAQCDGIALAGQCNQGNNLNNCYLSCSRCDTAGPIQDCYNLDGDTQCAAVQSSCNTNPAYMLTHCKKTCTACDRPPSYIGTAMLPGTASQMTLGMILVLPQSFPAYGQLTGFSAFFVSMQPVYLQIWRYVNSTAFAQVYSQRVVPYAINTVQTVIVNVCVNVKQDDRIGFLSMDGPAPIAYQLNENMIYSSVGTLIPTRETLFNNINLPYTFSLMAAFIPNGSC